MIDEKSLIDTNVLVYASDISSDKHGQAVEIICEAFNSSLGYISIQNLAEFSRASTKNSPRRLSFEQARILVDTFARDLELVNYSHKTVSEALGLCNAFGLHFYDALIAATMQQNGVKAIVTENEKDFKKIPWLKVINPFKQ